MYSKHDFKSLAYATFVEFSEWATGVFNFHLDYLKYKKDNFFIKDVSYEDYLNVLEQNIDEY